ncbi:hypothetical protein [Brevibacillus parabrevis]|uniref:CdiA C-terminal domain-containing protein n=1 Tax=Brevibacillus parabrevis TaxID=54914 RepID=UPI0028D48F88|nr:hypothetical protein [Brevibacillus parabrevis]
MGGDISKETFLEAVGIEFNSWDDVIIENDKKWGNFKLEVGAKPDMAERKVAAYLMMMGQDVTALNTKNNLGQNGTRTPDFLVDGVLTELKTLFGAELNRNTASGQISSGLRQGAQAVIIDAMKYDNVNEFDVFDILYKGFEIYHNNYPDSSILANTEIQIWTKEGIYDYNVGSFPYGNGYD